MSRPGISECAETATDLRTETCLVDALSPQATEVRLRRLVIDRLPYSNGDSHAALAVVVRWSCALEKDQIRSCSNLVSGRV